MFVDGDERSRKNKDTYSIRLCSSEIRHSGVIRAKRKREA